MWKCIFPCRLMSCTVTRVFPTSYLKWAGSRCPTFKHSDMSYLANKNARQSRGVSWALNEACRDHRPERPQSDPRQKDLTKVAGNDWKHVKHGKFIGISYHFRKICTWGQNAGMHEVTSCGPRNLHQKICQIFDKFFDKMFDRMTRLIGLHSATQVSSFTSQIGTGVPKCVSAQRLGQVTRICTSHIIR